MIDLEPIVVTLEVSLSSKAEAPWGATLSTDLLYSFSVLVQISESLFHEAMPEGHPIYAQCSVVPRADYSPSVPTVRSSVM